MLELINGVAYGMTPSPSLQHYQVSHGLERAIDAALDEVKRKNGGGECEMFHAPVDLYLGWGSSSRTSWSYATQSRKRSRGIEGAPDLVVEILSPGTAQKDWTHKRWAYQATGIPEYLIVDPDERVAVLLRLEEGQVPGSHACGMGWSSRASWRQNHGHPGTHKWFLCRFSVPLLLNPLVPLTLIGCFVRGWASLPLFVAIFGLAGLVNGIQDTLEGATTANLVPEEHRGLGFGLLGAVNGFGDFLSSLAVGALWTLNPALGFGFAALMMALGAGVVLSGARA